MNLGEIEFAAYVQYTASENQPDFASDESRDRDRYTGPYQAESEIGDLVNDIGTTFKAWIDSLPRANGSKKIKLTRRDDHSINFNYTSTLQGLYGIPDSEILYIYGKAPDEVLVLGHDKIREELTRVTKVVQPEPPADLLREELTEWYDGRGYMTQAVHDAAVNEMCRIRRNVEQIIQDNRSISSSINEIEHIYIYGFSFPPVDEPYTDGIISHIDKEKVRWIIGYYSDEDQQKVQAHMQSRKILPDLRELMESEDIQTYK